MQRIASKQPALRMPPIGSGKELSPDEIELLQTWIEEGSQWQQHWSFAPIRQPKVPKVNIKDWIRNPIDTFILKQLKQAGLEPSPTADKVTLIRRASLDLTGLPPTPSEVTAFLSDSSPNAYEQLLERLLASPRYGERMAWRWLEAARYADTNGYQTDGERYMWRWRDWVIQAFNQNMPFDQFTIEQIAGDMLPDAKLEQKIATGFNRNHSGNGEGGIIPEEYAVEYVVDRVDTTSTVWLGLTMSCARCHDHKYDPISQKEFYQLFAFFNNVPEKGDANKYGNSPPMIKAPTSEQEIKLRSLEDKVLATQKQFSDLDKTIEIEKAKWEASLPKNQTLDWTFTDNLVAHYRLDGNLESELLKKPEQSAQFSGSKGRFVTGLLGEAAAFDGKSFIDVGDIGKFGFYDKFSLGAWIHLTNSLGGTVLSRINNTDEAHGYSLEVREGKIYLALSVRVLDDALLVQTIDPLNSGQWHHILATYDGSRKASGVNIFIDGHKAKLQILLDDLNQSFETEEPFRIGARGGAEKRFHGYIDDVPVYHDQKRFHGYIDDVRVYSDQLEADEASILSAFRSVDQIVTIPKSQRTQQQNIKLLRCFLEQYSSHLVRQSWKDLAYWKQRKNEFYESLPTTMVMAEREVPRDTFLLHRGEYDKPGEKVTANVPSILPPLEPNKNKNRLSLARWLVDPSNPLTARVTVNRIWQMYFGVGLVKTSEDFGTRGKSPTHPLLLDWLATELLNTDWDLKSLHKTILMSATYRQSSRANSKIQKIDPENLLLSRGPRLRLSAEMIRDQALLASGLLVEKIGGPSVRPYQTAGLWRALNNVDYEQDSGENLYRRSLYTFWKRTIPPPFMGTFDAATRDRCVVREYRTNTPIQALTLLNSVTFVEAARVLAQRMIREGGISASDRITLGFRLVTSRTPNSREMKIFLNGLEYMLTEAKKDLEASSQLNNIGDSPPDPELEITELAAYTAMANLILNLDETVTKE